MVIQIIDIAGIAALKAKRDPPIPRNGYGVMPLECALERVQVHSGQSHIFRLPRVVKKRQNIPQFDDMFGRYLAHCSPHVERFQSGFPR